MNYIINIFNISLTVLFISVTHLLYKIASLYKNVDIIVNLLSAKNLIELTLIL